MDLPTRFGFAFAGRTRYSRRTVLEYIKVLKAFCIELSQRGFEGAARLDEALATIGPFIVEEWFIRLRGQGKKGSTLRFRDAVLKKFMEWLTTQEAGQVRHPSDHPYSDGQLKTTAPHPPAVRYLLYSEVSDFIRCGLHDESQRCLVHFMYDTGARVSEVARVKRVDLPDLTLYPEFVMYFPLTLMGSKGRGDAIKERLTIISRPMLERLLKLHNNWRKYMQAQTLHSPDQMPAFLNSLGQPIATGAIQKLIQTASQRLQRAGKLLKPIYSHRLRHGTAVSILQSNHGRDYLENLVVCQRALGHTSIRTTERYGMIPAPIIAQMRQLGSQHGFMERYQEANYIYEQSFKPQRNHTENRGHGCRHRNAKRNQS